MGLASLPQPADLGLMGAGNRASCLLLAGN